jgi:hypothetical protein
MAVSDEVAEDETSARAVKCGGRAAVLLVDGAKKLADGDQLMWKQTILVHGR